MAHAFQVIGAKNTFGTIAPNVSQSDYINQKKQLANTCLCKTNPYKCATVVGKFPFNKSDLVVSLYTKQDQQDICTVSASYPPTTDTYSCTPMPSVANLQTVITVDPYGLLFGNSQCGELNYTRYMRFYPRRF